jgi:NAD+ kinase
MAIVGIVVHPDRADAAELAERAAAWLTERGHKLGEPGTDALDLAVSLGGDGTMLRTVDLVTGAGVPVLGINVGNLGYLTEVEPSDLEHALERFLAGDYRIEERMTLDVDTGGKFPTQVALNEAWLDKLHPGHTVHLRLDIAGEPFTTYAADGFIVSTATGSTAYNLSVRGPILSPTLEAMVVKPVSPHQLFDFPLVLGPDEDVRLEVLADRPATLLVDGRHVGQLDAGDAVTCRRGAHPARLVRFGGRNFHSIIKAKFGLADR